MKSCSVKLFLLILLPAFLIQSVHADGCFFSSKEGRLLLPDQKAVISWDGTTEEMMIVSSVRSANISNIAWVIPLQSYTKPEVEAGNISVFEDLTEYFWDRSFWGRMALGGMAVEVVESKEVDIYDITILKADNANDLLEWLNSNGYKTPEEAEPIFRKHVEQGNMYFIANKLDLKNKHEEELELLPLAIELAKSELTERIESVFERARPKFNKLDCPIDKNHSEYGFYRNARMECTLSKIKGKLDSEHIKYTEQWEERVEREPKLMFEDGFTAKWEFTGYGYPLHYNIMIGNEYDPMIYYERYPKPTLYQSEIEMSESASREDLEKAEKYAGIIRKAVSENLDDLNYINDLSLEDSGYNHAYERLQEDDFLFVCNEHDESFQYRDMLDLGDGDDFVSLCRTMYALATGMATPLKLKFEPPRPYYPLEISSLGKGHAMIDVYMISGKAAYDSNNVMQETRTIRINNDLKEKLGRHINVRNSRYATRFSWDGDLKDLKADVMFEYKESFWQGILDWLKSLFGAE